MEFDSGNLRSSKLLHVVNVMNMVILYDREYAAHTSNDAGLLTVVDVTAAHDVGADGLFCPAVILCTAYRISLHLRRAFHVFGEKVVVIVFLRIVSEGDSTAF